MNRDYLKQVFHLRSDQKGPTAGRNHVFHLMVYNSDDKVLLHKKMRDEMLLNGPIQESAIFEQAVTNPRNKFTICVMSESWIGIDRKLTFVLNFTHIESKVMIDLFTNVPQPVVEATELPVQVAEPPVQVADLSVRSFDDTGLEYDCKHKCKDKSICLHNCCKTSARLKRTVAEQYPMSSTVSKRQKSTAAHRSVRRGINFTIEEDKWLNQAIADPLPVATTSTSGSHQNFQFSDPAPVASTSKSDQNTHSHASAPTSAPELLSRKETSFNHTNWRSESLSRISGVTGQAPHCNKREDPFRDIVIPTRGMSSALRERLDARGIFAPKTAPDPRSSGEVVSPPATTGNPVPMGMLQNRPAYHRMFGSGDAASPPPTAGNQFLRDAMDKRTANRAKFGGDMVSGSTGKFFEERMMWTRAPGHGPPAAAPVNPSTQWLRNAVYGPK